MELWRVVPLVLLALFDCTYAQLVVDDLTLTSCQDYYTKLNNRTNGNYLVEISPYVMIEVYCNGMDSNKPTEYLTLQQGAANNYANFFRYVGKPNIGPGTTCGNKIPAMDASGWGSTQFTRVRFNPVTKLVNMSDFTFAKSDKAGSMIDYGTAGDQFSSLRTANCFKGTFKIDLTGTPLEVDSTITWSWQGQMYDNAPNTPVISDSTPRQKVSGKCGGYPGKCFPALKRSKTIPKLALRVVTTNPCVHVNTTNPCKNGATCIPDTATAYRCRCLPGWSGQTCSEPEPDKVVTGPLSTTNDDSPSTATCPSGYTLTHCQCSISQCDGAVISTTKESCTVRNANLRQRVRAQINCTRYNTSLITTSVTRTPTSGFNVRYPSYTCPTGWKLLACTYHSYWYRNGRPDSGLGVVDGNTCKVDCKTTSRACAVYTKCYTDHCLCLNGGTCSAITHHCMCPPGYIGSRCEKFDYCAWQLAQQGSPPCQNGGTCQSVPSTAIGTYDADGIGGDCKLPFTFKQITFNQCVRSNIVGPPFACGVEVKAGKDYVDLGSWSPGPVFTIEGWVKPKLHLTGRKIIFGSVDSCNGWGLSMNNDKFSYMFRPKSGCTALRVSSTVGYIDQWHHVALTQDGNTMTLYVNGTKRHSAATRPTFVGSAASFRVGGAQCCLNQNWAGIVKNLNVWKKSLGATEIMKIYKNPLAPFNVTDNVIRNHLIAAYDFGDNPSAACTGGVDHGNDDWTPKDGEVISGIHCNIGLFYIPPGVTVTVAPWKRTKNSNTGVNGTVTIFAKDILIKGSLLADDKGYQGGATPTGAKQSGNQGESFSSSGSANTGQLQGGGGGGLGDPYSRSWGKPGGGGGHGTAGKNGYSRRGGQSGVGAGGSVNSHGDLRVLELGAGGGSGGNDNYLGDNPKGGKGGNGGGGIHLDARNTLTIVGLVSANGGAGQGDTASSCGASNCYGSSATSCWDWSGPGGGGAGGSVFLRGLVVDIGTNRVTAAGGRGGYGSTGCGGDGGMGRIRIDSHILNGNTNPAPKKVVINDTFSDLAVLARDALPPSAVASVPEPSVYLGCFEDNASRKFKYTAPVDYTLTPDKCKATCYQKGYKFYGLQYYRECFCDNNFASLPRKPDSDCNLPCDGDKNRECGGGWRLSVYGPVPRSPGLAMANAVQTCEPYCQTAWRSGRKLFGLCIGQGKVNSWNIKCSCPAGFTGSRCQTPCQSGKYGVDCKGTCQCQNKGVCDPVDGSCDCTAGWTGKTCTTACSATKFGPGCTSTCLCNRYCSPADSVTCGYTDKTHKVAFLLEAESGTLGTKGASVVRQSSTSSGGSYVEVLGADTYSASSAPLIASYTLNITVVGDYYVWMKVITPHGKADSVFVSFDNSGKTTWHIARSYSYTWRAFGGHRTLTVGIHTLKIWKRESGVKIDQVFIGPAQAASTCNRFNGSCTCQPGYKGRFCENPCDIGKYGVGCSQTCQCTTDGVCDPRDGSCHCLPGFQGATCNTTCTSGTYGTGCQYQCKCSVYGSCDPKSGACTCKPGYTGPTCNQLCPANHYGQGCTSVCQCRNGNCDAITGKCQCPPGYTGSNCGQACPSGKYGQDCKQTCTCAVGSSTCNHITGHCDCKPGFRGATCNLVCGNGRCGQGCKVNCRCNNHGRCDKTDCSCTCYTGWVGAGCATACGQGRYGVDCAQSCGCAHATGCNRFTGQCYCQNGWKGSKCDTKCASGTFGKNCASKCKCASANSQSCDAVTGACTCNKGWSGLFCETKCPTGTFGKDCLGNCSCQNGGACHQVHGACDCPRGYQGDKCQSLCSTGKFGYDCNQTCLCKNGASCDPIDGTCTCTAGWSGPLCDSACPSGTWGLQCANSCNNCSQGSCNPVNGACSCFDGFTGKSCDQPCPAGTFGAGCHQTCNCVNGACDITDGTCTCNPGYKGIDCSTKCGVGTYGVGCVSVCQRTCPNSLPGCDPVDGHCMCTPGWTGPWCNSSCPDGSYGQDCSKSCSSCVHPSKSLKCHPVTGACVCSHGYLGDNCDKPCDEGWWGLNCTEQCACPALRSTCDIVDGTCSCLPGYTGDSCDKTCPPGTWGAGCAQLCGACGIANPHGVCNPMNGNCECRAGWIGSACSTPCPAGKWGVNCQEDCLCEFGACSSVDGSCSCRSGYMGQYCDATCTNNTYGDHCSQPCQCKNGATCNAYNGACYCSPGYTGHFCEKECPDGYFGHLCSRKCDCENQAKCNVTTGECICPPGYVGARCEENCPDTNWGIDCKFACGLCVNGLCNNVHGGCDCDAGWQGANCSDACAKGTYGVDCANPCPSCNNNYPCHVTTGLCLCGGVADYCVNGYCSSDGTCGCNPGYMEDDCSTPCETGRWGEGCEGVCTCESGVSCDIATGECGCSTGKCGGRCEQTCDCPNGCVQETCECVSTERQTSSSTSDSFGTAGIVGIAVGCILLGVFLAVLIFVYLRYQANKSNSFDHSMDMTGQVKFDSNAENVGFSNPIYSTADEPIKANPLYSSKDDQLDNDNPDYTSPY